MSEQTLNQHTVTSETVWGWDAFWFAPGDVRRMSTIRGLLCLITAAYFISCWSDASFWYANDGPLSTKRVSTFLQTGGVEDAAQWIVSPLFLADSAWIYYVYLIIGIIVSGLVASGRGGRIACWALWLLLVGWANRAMFLSGLSETLLSLGLFASAVAPSQSSLRSLQRHGVDGPSDWTAGFSERLMAVQITLIGAATFITMLAGRVWFNGVGAYALAAPAEDRTIDLTDSWLVHPLVHESLTHLMMIALPLGFVLAWCGRTNRIGQAILIGWCITVALLTSNWLYAATFGVMVCAIRPANR